MSSPSGNRRKRRFSSSSIVPVVEGKRSRVLDGTARGRKSGPSPEAVSPTQSSQGSATAQTPSQEECSNGDKLKQATINLIKIKMKIEDTLKILVPSMPVVHQVPKPSGARQGAPKKSNVPQNTLRPPQMTSAKNPKQTTPTDDQNKSNHQSITEGAPPSDDSTVKKLINDVVSKEPQQPSQGKEKDMFLARIWILEILHKLGCNPRDFLYQMSLVAQAVGVGQNEYRPAWILYLNLARVDEWRQLKQENLRELQLRLTALTIDKEESDNILKELSQERYGWIGGEEKL